MASKKQIAANRSNARKSTGPRTEEGKARASMNAFKHGLTSRRVTLSDEDEERFREFRFGMMDELRPETGLETQLVCRIAAQLWRLGRIPGIEAELFERLRLRFDIDNLDGSDDGLGAAWERDGGAYGGALGRLARYEGAIERSLTRLLGELRRTQAERIRRDKELAARVAGEGGEGEWAAAGPDGRLMDPVAAEEAWERALEGNDGTALSASGGQGPLAHPGGEGATRGRSPTHAGSGGETIMAW